jgi:hypothetical protein
MDLTRLTGLMYQITPAETSPNHPISCQQTSLSPTQHNSTKPCMISGSCCNVAMQGSILVPLLFLLYINDLLLGVNTDMKLLLYADDTSVLVSGNNMHEIQAKSRMVLNTLNHWFTSNGLSLNLKKTSVKI